MPPKPKFTKDEIVAAALEITREGGLSSLTARALGERLGSSSRPIFTVFANMEEVADAVREEARRDLAVYLNESLEYIPAFKEFGLRLVRYAGEQPHLFEMLFSGQGRDLLEFQKLYGTLADLVDAMRAEISRAFGISAADASELLDHMVVFSVGIVYSRFQGADAMTMEEISHALSEVCVGLVLRFKVADGSFDLERARDMALRPDIVPRKRTEPEA